MIDVSFAILIIGAIMILAFFTDWIFKKTDVPSVIWLLLFGLALGPILKLVDPESFLQISDYVGSIAIAIILFDGGLNLDFSELIKGAPRGLLLALTSFIFTVGITALIMALLGYNWLNGVLLGAIIGGTSSPIVIPIAQKLKSLQERAKTVLSIESAVTDPLCIVVVIAVIFAIVTGSGVETAFQSLASVFSIGAIVGIISGLIWLPLMHAIRKEEFAYVLTLGVSLLLFAGAGMLIEGPVGIGAGSIAVLIFGIVLGNGRKITQFISKESEGIKMDKTTKEFHNMITFFISTFFFVYLGIIVSFTQINFILIGGVLTLALFAIRPLAVMIATAHSDFEREDRQIMSLLIPRGLAAAVLAYLPIAYNLPDTNGFADVAFTVILATTIIATIGIAVIDYLERRRSVADAAV